MTKKIVIRDIMKINLTIDHRFSDAGAGVKCFKTVRKFEPDYWVYVRSRRF